MSNTRVKINLEEGIIELEGSEEFVSRYLEEFKTVMKMQNGVYGRSHSGSIQTQATKPRKPGAQVAKDRTKRKTKTKAKKVIAERFDIHGGGETPSLNDFYSEKKPGTANGNRIAVIGYYITEILGNDCFSEGQIEYAYKMLKLDRPAHLHQIMVNNKNEKDYYEQSDGDEGAVWSLTRTGEIFVADELPAKSE